MRNCFLRLAFGLTLCLLAATPATSDPIDLVLAEMGDRDYKGAIAAIDARLASTKGAPKDAPKADERGLLALLRARAQMELGQVQAAIAAARTLADAGGPWSGRARFLQAEALIRAGKKAEAAKLVNAARASLAGDKARAGLAARYRALAGAAAKQTGAPGARKTDHARAAVLFGEAYRLEPDSKTRLGDLANQAEQLAALGKHKDAIARWTALLADRDADAAARARALFRRAESRLAGGPRHVVKHLHPVRHWRRGKRRAPRPDVAGARDDLKQLLEKHGKTEWAPRALFLLGASYKPEKGSAQFGWAVKQWRELIARFPKTASARKASFALGTAQRAANDLEAAIAAFDAHARRFPTDARAGEAVYQAALAALDIGRHAEARKRLTDYLRRYPTGNRWKDARDGIERAAFEAAKPHLRAAQAATGDAKAEHCAKVLLALADYLASYPGGAHAAAAHMLRGYAHYERKELGPAETEWRTLIARFGTSVEARKARLALAELAERAGDLEKTAAELEALRKAAPRTAEANEAYRRLARLRAIELDVSTPRNVRADDVATLRVGARNLAELEVMAYRLDLGAHIRKHKALVRIAEVATEIVAPDVSKTHKVAKYARYRRFDFDLPLAELKGPGAWIVEVRTGLARAKALVLKSDLDLVARVSGKQALAFVKRAGKKAAGVELTLYDDGGKLTTGKTGADGLLPLKWTRDDAGEVRILASHAGHYAYARTGVVRARSSDVAPQGYVYTDRPLYRPGDSVHYRTILRGVDVRSGSYSVPAGRKATVSVHDSRGLEIARQVREVDAYGAIAGTLALGAEPALGTYRIQVELPDRARGVLNFAGSFAVEEYRKPPFSVALTSGERLKAPGEKVSVGLKARYRFGTDVADANVTFYVLRHNFRFDGTRYRDFAWFFESVRKVHQPRGQVVHTVRARTDSKGEARFDYTLPRTNAEQRYVVFARVADRAGQMAEGATEVFAVLERVHAILRPDRKVYQPNEQALVRLTTVEADHRPIALDGTVILERLVDRNWQPVSRHKVTTDRRGRADVRLKATEPGRHRVRFVHRDGGGRFADTTATASLDVAGPTRSRELVVRAEKTVYRQGERARVHLSTPAPGLDVLLTFEAEGILAHRVVHVSGRATALDWTMKADFAPNGYLSATVLHDGQLFSDRDAVVVLEYLDVAVAPSTSEARAGEKISIDVTTRDQRGQPIAAAVSLAVVDGGIFQLAADSAGPIKSKFYNRRRYLGVRGCGSVFHWKARRLDALRGLADENKYRDQTRELEGMRRYAEARSLDPRRSRNWGPKKPKPEARPVPPKTDAPTGGAWRAKDKGDGYKRANKKGKSAGDAIFEADDADHNETNNADDFQNSRSEQLGRQLASSMLFDPDRMTQLLGNLRHRRTFRDTAFWAPSIETGKDGKATVELTLPDNLTTWAISARGATQGNQVGQGSASLVSTQPLLLQLRAPRYLIERDKATGTLEIHNATDREVKPAVGFAQNDEPSSEAVRPDRESHIGPTSMVRMKVALDGRGKLGPRFLEASVLGGSKLGDAIQRAMMVLPAGTRVLKAGAGRLASAAERDVRMPPYADTRDARLLIGIDPDPDLSLERALDELKRYPYGCFEQTVSRFLPALAAIHAYKIAGRPNDRLSSRFLPLAAQGLRRVYNMQRRDGGWGWWPGNSPRPSMTGYGLYALEMCRTSGLVPVVNDRIVRARKAARKAYRGASDAERALLMYALSLTPERRDLSLLWSLARRREALSPAAVAMTALAAHHHGQAALSTQLLDVLRRTAQRDARGLYWKGKQGFLTGTLESTSLATLALTVASGQPDRDRIRGSVDYLMASRHGAGWGTTKTSAMAILAVAHARALLATPPADYTIKVTVNGEQVGELKAKAGKPIGGRTELRVPARLLRDKNTIVFDKQGEGTLFFWYRLETFRRGKVKPYGAGITVRKQLFRSSDPIEARQAPVPGHSIIVPEKRPLRPVRPVGEAAVGEVLRVSLEVDVDRDADYVMLEDPLPAGVFVEKRGVSGKFDRQETRLDKKVFFFTRLRQGTHKLSYLVRCQFPGKFTINPARAELMYRPAVYGHGATHALKIVERHTKGEQAETPDAKLARAEEALRKGDLVAAEKLFLQLLARPLRVEIVARIARQLVELRADKGGAPLLTAYEKLREASPSASLPDRLTARVADAYSAAGRADRALELDRILCDRQLSEVGKLANAYRGAKQPVQAQTLTGEWLRRLPDTPAMRSAWFAWAAAWAQTPGDKGVARFDEAIDALTELQALLPQSPTARLAGWRVVELTERIGAHERAVHEVTRYLARHPKAPRRDNALYSLARNAFAAGKYDVADQAAAKLATATYRTGSVVRPSPHRPYAIYLRAKIAHSRGQIAAAIAGYRKVAGNYPDAADAVAFYERKVLEVDRVIRVAPDQAAKLPVRYRNVDKLELALYPVDLLTLFVMRGGQGTMRGIDLSGIDPAKKLTRDLPAAAGFEMSKVGVEVGKLAAGAYLVVGRAGDREVSAFVLVSDLQMKVQREGGRVYVHVTRKGKPAAGVQVRVAAGGRVVGRGTTDARGVFSYAGRGHIAVVAFTQGGEKDSKAYALWSSK